MSRADNAALFFSMSDHPIPEIDSPELPLLYIDDDLLALSKPAGLRVIPDGYHPELPSVKSILEAQLGSVFIVHRLDKDTSGALIVARNAESHRALNLQFENRQVTKEYHAFVVTPIPFPAQLVVDQPLLVNGDRRHRTRVDIQRGKPAVTEFASITQFSTIALIKASPKSGYTHQIRAHAAFAGFPLLADALYSPKEVVASLPSPLPDFPRVALHAYQIQFHHPLTRLLMTFTSATPLDFTDLLKKLTK